MGRTNSLVFFIPDTVKDVEILRIGSACYPHGDQGEPETVADAMHWAVQSSWGIEKLTSLGVTWAMPTYIKGHRRNRMTVQPQAHKEPLRAGAVGAALLGRIAAEYKQLRPAADEHVALEVWTQMVRATADQLAAANPRFEFVRFFSAAGVPGQH